MLAGVRGIVHRHGFLRGGSLDRSLYCRPSRYTGQLVDDIGLTEEEKRELLLGE